MTKSEINANQFADRGLTSNICGNEYYPNVEGNKMDLIMILALLEIYHKRLG